MMRHGSLTKSKQGDNRNKVAFKICVTKMALYFHWYIYHGQDGHSTIIEAGNTMWDI